MSSERRPKMAREHSTEWWEGCPRCHNKAIRTRRVSIDGNHIVTSNTCLTTTCSAEYIDVYGPLYKVVTDGT